MECYDLGTPEWPQWLGLKRMGWNRRGARYGFPLHRLGVCMSGLLERGISVMVIREQPQAWHRIKLRAPVLCDCGYLAKHFDRSSIAQR